MIQKGDKFICIKDVMMDNDPNDIAYYKGKVYICEENECITDEQGNIHHIWEEHGNIENNNVKDYFTRVSEEFVSQESTSQKEMINHPLHYQGLEVNGTNVECIDAMEGLKGWYNTAIFCELNAFKYNWRVGEKDMIPQELGKIAWYGNKAKELWNKAFRWIYPKNGHKYAIVNQGVTRMKNPTTKEWTDAIIYTDGKGFYVREASEFNKKFKLEE